MEGLPDEEIAVRFREFKERQAAMTEDLPYPGGECAADVIRRAGPVLERLAESGHERDCRGDSRRSDPNHGSLVSGDASGKMEASWKGFGKYKYHTVKMGQRPQAFYTGTL